MKVPQTYMHPGISRDLLALSKARRRAFVLTRNAAQAERDERAKAAEWLRDAAAGHAKLAVMLRARLANPDGYLSRGVA